MSSISSMDSLFFSKNSLVVNTFSFPDFIVLSIALSVSSLSVSNSPSHNNIARPTIPFEKFVQNAIVIHGSKFTYFKNEYKTYKKNTLIKCNDCKLMFSTSPQHHAGPEGTGCPNCAISGFNRNKPAVLYYLKITTNSNKVLYKIGITNRSVNERFNLTDLSKIEIIKQKEYENGQDAYDKEQEILKRYKKFKYSGKDILSNGNTEIFTIDILNCGT